MTAENCISSEDTLTTANSRSNTAFRAVELAHHEFAANFIFDEQGLTPLFAAARQVTAGESQHATFRAEGERWQVTLHSQQSGLVHPGQRLPGGTDWPLERMREFRLSVKRHPDEDPIGQ